MLMCDLVSAAPRPRCCCDTGDCYLGSRLVKSHYLAARAFYAANGGPRSLSKFELLVLLLPAVLLCRRTALPDATTAYYERNQVVNL